MINFWDKVILAFMGVQEEMARFLAHLFLFLIFGPHFKSNISFTKVYKIWSTDKNNKIN